MTGSDTVAIALHTQRAPSIKPCDLSDSAARLRRGLAVVVCRHTWARCQRSQFEHVGGVGRVFLRNGTRGPDRQGLQRACLPTLPGHRAQAGGAGAPTVPAGAGWAATSSDGPRHGFAAVLGPRTLYPRGRFPRVVPQRSRGGSSFDAGVTDTGSRRAAAYLRAGGRCTPDAFARARAAAAPGSRGSTV